MVMPTSLNRIMGSFLLTDAMGDLLEWTIRLYTIQRLSDLH